MAGSGWIKLHRQLLKWEWWEDHNTTRLFVYFLLEANHAPKKWKGVVIDSGQFVTSIRRITKETGLSMQQTRTSINKLKSTHEITHKSTSKYTVISICNWDIYQNGEEEDNTLSNKRATNEQQTSNNKQE